MTSELAGTLVVRVPMARMIRRRSAESRPHRHSLGRSADPHGRARRGSGANRVATGSTRALVVPTTWVDMRALSTTSKMLVFVAAALGVVASLGLPWFAASPAVIEKKQDLPTIDGPV